jgi:hypothetical protein
VARFQELTSLARGIEGQIQATLKVNTLAQAPLKIPHEHSKPPKARHAHSIILPCAEKLKSILQVSVLYSRGHGRGFHLP